MDTPRTAIKNTNEREFQERFTTKEKTDTSTLNVPKCATELYKEQIRSERKRTGRLDMSQKRDVRRNASCLAKGLRVNQNKNRYGKNKKENWDSHLSSGSYGGMTCKRVCG